VQGDNLHALKALLPRYAGQVKCIYIDPPYNTGNEGWAYNDNVNSPEIRKWLGEVVGKEGETLDRHDRWLCMMYPRLVLLRQFLREDGAIFVSIDDNEVATLRLLMDEILAKNFAGQGCHIRNTKSCRTYPAHPSNRHRQGFVGSRQLRRFSGSTGHAVIKQNAEDSGNRRFILVEMDADIARNVTTERVQTCRAGLQQRQGANVVAGFGGDFQFCTLSPEPLFTPEGQIRSDVSFRPARRIRLVHRNRHWKSRRWRDGGIRLAATRRASRAARSTCCTTAF
jgi:hypothetical protein